MESEGSILDDVRIVHFTGDRIADPRAARRTLSWQDYHTARNAIVRACSRHATTGPMGERPITDDEQASNDGWPIAPGDAQLFVLDDQPNHERYLYLEVSDPSVIGPPLMADLIAALQSLPVGWGLGVNGIDNGYLLLFSAHVLVTGPAFESEADIGGVVLAWRRAAIPG